MVDAINSTYAAAAGGTAEQGGSTVPGTTLQVEDFFRLLVAQMQYQNPLEPTSEQDFLNQMLQFSMVQQMVTVGEKIEEMRQAQSEFQSALQADLQTLQWQQALSLVGMQVEGSNAAGEFISGAVTGVRFSEGAPQLVVEGENSGLLELANVAQAARPPEPENQEQAGEGG